MCFPVAFEMAAPTSSMFTRSPARGISLCSNFSKLQKTSATSFPMSSPHMQFTHVSGVLAEATIPCFSWGYMPHALGGTKQSIM